MSHNFSAVVVNYNGSDFLMDAVNSLLRAGVAANKIIVVDNGSSDNSIKELLLRHPEVPVIEIGCNAGFAVAVNRGLDLVTTKYALLFNNDALLDVKALGEFERVFEDKPKSIILGAKLLNPDGTLQNSIAEFPHILQEVVKLNKYRGINFDKVTKVESVIGACLAIRMNALKTVGKLDEDFFFFLEETEFCLRATNMGYDVYYVPTAIATHAQGGTANKFKSLARIEFQRSKLIYYRKTKGIIIWPMVSLILITKSLVNFSSNLILFLLTAGLNNKFKMKTVGYFKILLWHILFRPSSWGLPNKCRSESS
jgi:GT2 family glycosyltransferase